MTDLNKFLEAWQRSHPIVEPQPEEDKVLNYLLNGGVSPLPLWPDLPEVK